MSTIMFTRAAASSADTLMVAAVLDEENDEATYQPAARVFRYEHMNAAGSQWFYDDVSLSVQDICVLNDVDVSPGRARFFALLGAEGEIYYFSKPDQILERIEEAGTNNPGSMYYGHTLSITQIGQRPYVAGTGGQIYVRDGRDDWRMLTDEVLFDPEAEEIDQSQDELEFLSEEWLERATESALNPASPDIIFHDIEGLSEDSIYLCGSVGPGRKPVLYYWDGQKLEELKVPLEEAALTGIHIENSDSVWVCGREGVLLHGSRARGFNPVAAQTRLNLFHGFTKYRGRLVIPATVRPGGLWQLDPKTGEFGRFEPRLPKLHMLDSDPSFPLGGPFFAQAFGDVLWVVANKDIFRFDGQDWQRIKHPDLP